MNDDKLPNHQFSEDLSRRPDVQLSLDAAGLGAWELALASNEILGDSKCRELFGRYTDSPLTYQQLISHLHPGDAERISSAFQEALNHGSKGILDQIFRLYGIEDGLLRTLRFQGGSFKSDVGEVHRLAGVVQEVSEAWSANQRIAEIDQMLLDRKTRLGNIIKQFPGPLLIVRGDDFVIDEINPPMLELIGQGSDAIGQPMLSLMPELADEFAWQQVRRAYYEGIEYNGSEILVTHSRAGVVSEHFYNLSYRPLREGGVITGVIQAATDITNHVLARRKLEETETKLRGIIAAAPAGIGLFIGRDLIIESPNQTFIDIVGRGPGVEGLPLREAMPELVTEGQPFLKVLDEVFMTGVPFISPASLVKIVQNGSLNDNYYNISYTPLRNNAGEIYGILDIAIDVTEQVRIQQALEEKESTLRGAIEIADMGIWELNMKTGITTYSERLKMLFEFTEDYIHWEQLYNPIHEDDRDRLKNAVKRAAQEDLGGFLDEEYIIVTAFTGRHRIVRAQAKMYFDKNGKPDKLVGSMRDVTEQRQTQWALEQLVRQRTEELEAAVTQLAAANEELAAGNEEYAAINERMEDANSLLRRSNESLETFAYVASHDLQEPLRKIQQFSNLLISRYAGSLGDGALYIERMQSAASRMSALIEDLLDFSRVAAAKDIGESVSLEEIVAQVLSTLELTIQETNAQVVVGSLPIITGNASQLRQLFQNLLSNALKFSRVDRSGQPATPVIDVQYDLVTLAELPARVKPFRTAAQYHCIAIADNGIGFDEKYLERIFQLFQRLHGRNEFDGTGIGLAISERVVHNHGGAITANSQPGEGATFWVYLPL